MIPPPPPWQVAEFSLSTTWGPTISQALSNRTYNHWSLCLWCWQSSFPEKPLDHSHKKKAETSNGFCLLHSLSTHSLEPIYTFCSQWLVLAIRERALCHIKGWLHSVHTRLNASLIWCQSFGSKLNNLLLTASLTGVYKETCQLNIILHKHWCIQRVRIFSRKKSNATVHFFVVEGLVKYLHFLQWFDMVNWPL